MHIPPHQIEPLSVNGLNGRLLHVPYRQKKRSKKTILLIYGIHSSHERMHSIAEFLADYGEVYSPDLPGLGGMNSFYSIGLTPSLDLYADYLYSFLKAKGLTSKVTVVAMSFGFLVVTRMLQRHEDAQEWFDNVVSFVGFGRASDFKNLPRKQKTFLPTSQLFRTRFGSWLIRRAVFNPLSLRVMFSIFRLFNPKYKHSKANGLKEADAMELDLWQKNDARTRFAIYCMFFTFDLTKHAHQLPIPLHDMTTKTDQYFDHARVNKTLKILYSDVSHSYANLALHAPSIIGSVDDIREIFSDDAKSVLTQ